MYCWPQFTKRANWSSERTLWWLVLKRQDLNLALSDHKVMPVCMRIGSMSCGGAEELHSQFLQLINQTDSSYYFFAPIKLAQCQACVGGKGSGSDCVRSTMRQKETTGDGSSSCVSVFLIKSLIWMCYSLSFSVLKLPSQKNFNHLFKYTSNAFIFHHSNLFPLRDIIIHMIDCCYLHALVFLSHRLPMGAGPVVFTDVIGFCQFLPPAGIKIFVRDFPDGPCREPEFQSIVGNCIPHATTKKFACRSYDQHSQIHFLIKKTLTRKKKLYPNQQMLHTFFKQNFSHLN